MKIKSESAFKKIVKTEAKDASIYTLLTFITQLGSFIIIPLFWKKLTPADYGVIAVIDLVAAYIVLFAGLSLENCVPRFYYEWNESERRRNLGAVWILNWANILVVGFGSMFIFSFISHMILPRIEFYPYLYLGLISKILTCLTSMPFQTVRINRQPYVYCVYSMFNFIVGLGMSVYFVLILNKGLIGYLTAGVISSIIISIGSAILMLCYAVPCVKSTRLKESFKYALPMIPSNIVANITSYMDSFILQRFVSLEILGIYFLSTKFSRLLFSLHSALKMSYIPFIFKTVSEHPIQETRENISRINLLYILPILMMGLVISVFISDFVFYINRPSYFPVIKYVPYLIIPSIISTFYMYLAPGLLLAKRTDLLWIPNIMQLGVVVVAGIILIPKFKISGIIIVNYLNHLTYFFVAWRLSEKVFPMSNRWKKIFILAGMMVLCIILTNSLVTTRNVVFSILVKSAVVIFYGVAGLVIIAGFERIKTRMAFYRGRLLEEYNTL